MRVTASQQQTYRQLELAAPSGFLAKKNPEDNGYRLNGILGPDARLNAATLLQGKPSRLLSNRRAASGCPAVNWGEKQALPHRVIVRKK